MPERSTALMCRKTSLPPSSGWMNPNPFCGLNYFTVPVSISDLLWAGGLATQGGPGRCDYATDRGSGAGLTGSASGAAPTGARRAKLRHGTRQAWAGSSTQSTWGMGSEGPRSARLALVKRAWVLMRYGSADRTAGHSGRGFGFTVAQFGEDAL